MKAIMSHEGTIAI